MNMVEVVCYVAEFVVDRLAALLSKETQREAPLSDEWDDVILEHMKFGWEGPFSKRRPKVSQQFLDVLICVEIIKKN